MSWFSAYLCNNTQSAGLTDTRGKAQTFLPLPNDIGILQGSSLGPFLYCIFANDLSLFGEDTVVQDVDDTQVLVGGKNPKFTKPYLGWRGISFTRPLVSSKWAQGKRRKNATDADGQSPKPALYGRHQS